MTDADLQELNRKLDRILHLLGDGRKDMDREADRIIELKLHPKVTCATKEYGRAKKR